MATSGITSSLLSQIADSPSTANQFVTDLNQLSEDLQSGNLSAAQEDYVTLSEDAQNGVTSSTGTSSSSGITTSLLSDIAASLGYSTSFVNDLTQMGTDLQNGDLSGAQSQMLALDATALSAASSAGSGSTATTGTGTTGTGTTGATSGTGTSGTGTSGAGATSTAAGDMEQEEIIVSVVDAMVVGDDSAVSAGFAELASVSTNSQGTTIFSEQSTSFGEISTNSSNSDLLSQLLQSVNSSNSGSTTSALGLFA